MSVAASSAAKPTRAGRRLRRALALGSLALLALGAQSAGAACGSMTTIGDELELNQAIADFNAETTTPCVFTVLLDADIALTSSTTRTHALSPASPAIDTGDTDLGTDQRGFSRPAAAADDIGAFEEAQLGSISVVKAAYASDPTDYDFTLDGGELKRPIAFQLDAALDLDDVYNSESFKYRRA